MSNKVCFSKFIEKILEFEKEFLLKIIGYKGLYLYNFAANVDKKNPYLDSFFNQDYAHIYQIIILSKYAFDNNLNLAFKSTIDILKSMDLDFICPSKNRHIRFLNEKERKNIRLSKNNWKFSSNYFKENIKKIWNETPEDIFFCKKNIEKLEKMSREFHSIGCFEFTKSISRHLDILNSNEYHQYKKIKIEVAACILAKMNNIEINNEYEPVIYPYDEFQKFSSEKIENKIKIAENLGFPFFDSYLILIPSFRWCDKKMDIEILEKKISFLLGEKEEEFYFIDLWN